MSSHFIESGKENLRVGIVLVNWNSPYDTIEAVESVLDIETDNKVIVVVDNNSADQSVDTIFNHFFAKGISIFSFDAGDCNSTNPREMPKIILIRNEINAGFAGGNNVAIKYLLEQYNTEFIWLLNNDAIVDSHTLDEMLLLAESNSELGFVGSVIRYYERPNTLQCFGGGFIFPAFGMSKLYLKNVNISKLHKVATKSPDYIMGVSLLVRAELIRDIGLMCEDYFMYYEESDWQLRGKRTGWQLAVAPKSYVFHKDSGSTANASHCYFYYLNRAAILFSKRNYSPLYGFFAALILISLAFLKVISNPATFKPTVLGIVDGLKGINGEKKWQ